MLLLDEEEARGPGIALVRTKREINSAKILSDKLNINSYQSLSETKIYQFLNSIWPVRQKGKESSQILLELKEIYDSSFNDFSSFWYDDLYTEGSFSAESINILIMILRDLLIGFSKQNIKQTKYILNDFFLRVLRGKFFSTGAFQ